VDKKLQFFIITMFFLLGVQFNSLAQKKQPIKKSCIEVSDKKAIKLYEQGKDKKKYEKKQRMEFLRQAIEIEPDYVEALSLLSEEQIKTAKYEGTSFKPSEKYLQKIIELCPDYDPYAYFFLGQIAYGSRQYSDAKKYYEKFLKYPDEIKTDADYDFADKMSKKAADYAEIFEKPVPFNPFCVEDVSTKDDEYLAIISPDNELMFFTRRFPAPAQYHAWASDKLIEEFCSGKRKGDKFEQGRALPPPFNKGDNYGGATITSDNKHLYVTVCRPNSKKYMNCDIFVSDWVNGHWSELRNLGPNVNTEDGWEAQPTISADGKSLYFSTYREGSQGMDIYKSVKNEKGEWGPAENVGPPINTEKHEKSPFIHSDSQTLYFSSDGHAGLGGYDIFMVKADDNGNWKRPKNLGSPINTENDEVGFFVSTDGKLGYFASNSMKGKCKGGFDIFAFDLYKEARPEEILFIKGDIKDENGVTGNAKVKIRNTTTKKVMEFDVDSTDGTYVAIVAVKKDEDLVLSVKKDGKAFSSELINAKENLIGKPQKLSSEVKDIVVGGAYKLNNINYATNSADLTPESLEILDEFITFLNDNPSIKVAIHGHTDDVGKDDFNMTLSTDRAFSVMQYLQKNEISKDRLSFKGFGKTKPLVPNTSEENRALNRRTEFMIIEK
jgi:outer membrane protein OmpA-like peptidoglycan-associated protein